MGTKQNPGDFDCYEAAEEDEPMFVLLARDPLAPVLVRHWASLRAELGIPTDTEKINEALRVASEMNRWASDHPDHGPFKR